MKLFRPFLIILIFFTFGCGASRDAATRDSKKIEDKYAQLLGVTKENISNKKLFSFIDEWYGTPYKYCGKTKNGVDCSGFTSILFKEVYNKELIGSSSGQYNLCKPISKEELKEGDLVFFKIDSQDISHIGIYLQNNRFVHATTKAGVMINNLNEEYYKKYFFEAGRVK